MLGGQTGDRLRVRAGLGTAVDGGQDQPIAVVVEQSGGERQPSSHVVEGVVANHVELLQRQSSDGGLFVLGLDDSVETALDRIEPSHRATHRTEDVPITAISPQDHVLLAGLPQAGHQYERGQETEDHDPADDGEREGEFVHGEGGHGAPSYTRHMRPDEVKVLLRGIEDGSTTVEEAYRALAEVPVEDIDFARIDTHRELRQGMPEAIYAEGKTPGEVAKIASILLDRNDGAVIATRVPPEMAELLIERFPDATHHAGARVMVFRDESSKALGRVAVVAAGTSDRSVAEEAAVVADAAGAEVTRITDVGVAGVHRLLAEQQRLNDAQVVIVVAGMEGALASLVGGIVTAPVVAVPTSVGYGASFDGLAALLAMLNSCAAGVAVMNIDNGFGAAMFALRLLRVMKT